MQHILSERILNKIFKVILLLLGQCLSCDGEEVLLTSWLLRSKVDTCEDKWRSTLIGQDTFTRYEQTSGPRKKFETNVPSEKVVSTL